MELERLEWRHVDLSERHIEVAAAVSKTGRRRIVDIEPNLRAWLTRYIENGGRTSGQVTPVTNLRTRLRDIRAAAKLKAWPQDVMGHSYASYWLAHHEEIDRLTLQMGHQSPDMLFEHYNRAAKRKDAAKFWKITPSVKRGGKVISFSEAA
jgi:integrase